MAEAILMPKMSDTMEEGVIASWLVKPGDEVSSGDVLAEVETDKATMELESYNDGTILYIADAKSAVPIDGVIAVIGQPGEAYEHLLGGNGSSQAAAESAPEAEAAPEAPGASAEKVDVSDINAEAILMPKMSDTMEEGVIASWQVKVGDEVSSGDILAEVETDKATMELESYNDGTILYIAAEAGESVAIDSVIAIIGEKGADYQALLKHHQQGGGSESSGEAPQTSSASSSAPAAEALAPAATPGQAATTETGRVKASPLAKKMAQDKGYDIGQIKGSGEGGRVVKRDVEAFQPSAAQPSAAQPSAAPQPPAQAEAPAAEAPAPQATYTGEERYEDQPVSQMRKVIARRLGESKFSAPHFYLTMDIDMDNAIDARKRMNELSPVKISFNDLVIKASAMALRQHPAVNAAWMGDKIRYNQHIHVGMAVAVDEGLLVPVIRFTDNKTLSQIAAESKDFAKRAKDKKLQPSDWEGNTFSVSNLGMFGIEEFTAIINPPDSCILAIGAIKQVPVVKDGQVVPGNLMRVTLSCDHRVVDGASGAAFLQTLKGFLEDPIRMMI